MPKSRFPERSKNNVSLELKRIQSETAAPPRAAVKRVGCGGVTDLTQIQRRDAWTESSNTATMSSSAQHQQLHQTARLRECWEEEGITNRNGSRGRTARGLCGEGRGFSCLGPNGPNEAEGGEWGMPMVGMWERWTEGVSACRLRRSRAK